MAAQSTDIHKADVDSRIAFVLACAAAIWLFLQTSPWPDTPDGFFHLQRTRALADALRQGVLYPRWFPDFSFGYGHPILHYYAPGFYYPPALIHLLGLDLISATRLALALIYGLSGAAAYLALRILTAPPAALVGSVITLLFPYRLYDLWVRGALPEFAAFLWPPLLLYASIRVLRTPGPWWTSRSALTLALAWAALALTHNLTALMAALMTLAALPLIAWLCRRSTNYAQALFGTTLRLGLPALLGALLSGFYTMPALLEAYWVGIGTSSERGDYTVHFANWSSLWQIAARYRYPAAADPVVPLPVYALPLIMWGGILLAWPRYRRFSPALALGAVCGLVWLTTVYSAPLWAWGAPLLGKLQFPWRWQTILTLAFGVLAALLVDGVIAVQTRPTRAWLGASVTSLLILIYAAGIPITPQTRGLQPRDLWAFDAEHGQVGSTWTGEFLPRWVIAPRWTIGRGPETPPPLQPPVEVVAAPVNVGYLDTVYAIQAAAPLTVTLDRFYFPVWQIQIDGTAQPAFPAGELGLLSVSLPSGDHQLAVAWRATPAIWLGRAVTLLGWLLVLYLLARQGQRVATGGWLALGGVAALSMTGVTATTTTPALIGGDFGSVRLEAVEIAPVYPGDAARVRLYWTANAAPADLVLFVHILGPDGSVLAQWDEPLGTSYRPAGRIQPGMIFRQEVVVPLPADIAAGEYAVVAGLYPAGAPDAPLTATHTADALTTGATAIEVTRLPLGTLEVNR